MTRNDGLVVRAKGFATQAHNAIGHIRKYSKLPYTTHLERVANIVASVTTDETMIAAAWLHDVVEDTPTTIEDIRIEFGDRVAMLVDDLTDVSKPTDGKRAQRRGIDRAHSARAHPDSKTIKLADVIDNMIDITDHDPDFGRVYLGETELLLKVLTEGNPELYRRAVNVLNDSKQKIGMK